MKKLLKFSVLTIGLLLALGFASCNQGNNANPDTDKTTTNSGEAKPSTGDTTQDTTTTNPDNGTVTPDNGTGTTDPVVVVTIDPEDEEERIADASWENAVATVKAVEGVPNVYSAEFDGEYFLTNAINANLKDAGELLAYLSNNMPGWKTVSESNSTFKINVKGVACSSIVAKNKTEGTSGYIFGRNFDWDEGPSLILHTKPIDGYESVSTCYLPFVDEGWNEIDATTQKFEAISCVYVPMDGMNEKGLYIANLQNDTYPVMPEEGDTTKKYVQTTVAIRYILDKAATVDEAVAWLKTINMCPVYADMGDMPDYHFAIADNSGKYVVVEWIEGELKTVESRVVTNHSLVNPLPDPGTLPENMDLGTYNRYDSLKATGEAKNWEMTSEEIKDALADVQRSNSVWSAVFEPAAKRVTYYFRKANPRAGIDETDPTAVHEAEDHPMDYTKPVVIQF